MEACRSHRRASRLVGWTTKRGTSVHLALRTVRDVLDGAMRPSQGGRTRVPRMRQISAERYAALGRAPMARSQRPWVGQLELSSGGRVEPRDVHVARGGDRVNQSSAPQVEAPISAGLAQRTILWHVENEATSEAGKGASSWTKRSTPAAVLLTFLILLGAAAFFRRCRSDRRCRRRRRRGHRYGDRRRDRRAHLRHPPRLPAGREDPMVQVRRADDLDHGTHPAHLPLLAMGDQEEVARSWTRLSRMSSISGRRRDRPTSRRRTSAHELVTDRDRCDQGLPPESEVVESAISCTKFVVASKGAAWPAPSISRVVAVGMAAASERTRRRMLSGLREP